jgi:16S rRNA (guanine527-N7)-methyltransferase
MADFIAFVEEKWTEHERRRFHQFYALLVEWNEKMNLTGIVEQNEVYVKHFWDSLMIRDFPEWTDCVRREGRVVDVGTGAGFPGIPLAICFPSVQFVLCDSLNKRISFLQHVVEQLELTNVKLVHGRAEDLARLPAYRGQFDVVVSRAVARMNLLLELTAPFAKVGGTILSYKGPSVEEEWEDGERAGRELGCELVRVERIELPGNMGTRTVVVGKQVKEIPKRYPRKAGVPQKNPL